MKAMGTKSKLFTKNKPLTGLDISPTGIKMMSIDSASWRIDGYGSLDLDPAKIQESLEGADETYLTNNIQSMLSNNIVGNLKSTEVTVGIPTVRTYSRTFTIPLAQLTHLKDAVNIEVEQYIPVPLNLLYVDHEIAEKNTEKGVATVVMTAVPKQIIDSIVTSVKSAGLTPILIEPGINAVARVIEMSEEGRDLVTMIIDISSASTDIAILDSGAIRVTGSVPIGGNTFTLDISKKMDLTLEIAHQHKITLGLNLSEHQNQIRDSLNKSLLRIATEARKVMRYYNERLVDNRKIEQVLIVGGGANVPGIGDFYTNELVMPARVASPWQNLNFGDLPEPSKQFRPRYISVAGLASIPIREVWK